MTVTADRVDVRKQLEAKTQELATEHKVPGVAIGTFHDGEEGYTYHGVTSLENPLPVDARTLFQIGSTTKTFTATAIMRLVEEGRVRLDDTVRTYVPEFRVQDELASAKVTVLQILNHTAGWAGDFFDDTGAGDDAIARYVERMAQLKQVNPPGAIASYNNAAYVLAGRLIEKVTGQVYEAAIKQLVLQPLGLDESFFFAGDVITRRFAAGHSYKEKDEAVKVARPLLLPRSSAPAGGIWATARDQMRYARFHLGDGTGAKGVRVLSKETLDLMKTPTFSLEGSALGDYVGISWLIQDIEGVRLVAHGGTTTGQQSAFVLVPERNFAITILTNSTKGGELHRDLLKWALETYLDVVERDPEILHLDNAALTEYTGEYVSDTSTVTLSASDAGIILRIRYTEAGLQQLKAISDEPPEEPPDITIQLIGKDQYTCLDGRYKGLKGNFVREDGRITGINLGGRLATKVVAGDNSPHTA